MVKEVLALTLLVGTFSTEICYSQVQESCEIWDQPSEPMLFTSGGTELQMQAIWERTLVNDDGNQNHFSIAQDSQNIYVAIDYFDNIENRRGNLFIRKYDKATGEENAMTMQLPDDYETPNQTYNYLTIFNDETLTPYVAYFSFNNGLTLNIRQLLIAEESYGELTSIYLTSSDNFATIDAVIDVNGSIANQEYNLILHYFQQNNNVNTEYFIAKIDNGSLLEINNYTDTLPAELKDGNKNLTIAFHPSNPANYFLSSKENIVPHYFYANITSRITEAEWDHNYCRGMYSFQHNGQAMFVMPIYHDYNTNKSQFCLFAMPDVNDLKSLQLLTLMPQNPFTVSNQPYTDIKQLAITETTVSEERSLKSRADLTSNITKLYVYAPGAGIAAYSINVLPSDNPGVNTSIEQNYFNMPYITRNGNRLIIYGNSAHHVKIYAIDGKFIADQTFYNGSIDLSTLNKGIYIFVVDSATIKVAL